MFRPPRLESVNPLNERLNQTQQQQSAGGGRAIDLHTVELATRQWTA